jgi:hypothetical protein
MNRLLLATGVLVLVLVAAGCGGSHRAASIQEIHPLPQPVVDRAGNLRIEERELAAGRRAERLLHRVVLPPGARRISRRAGSGAVGAANLGVNVFTQYAYRHAFWRVREKADAVEGFFRHHPTPGFTLGASGGEPVSIQFGGKPSGGRIGQGELMVTLGSSAGFTVIRVDAGSAWTYPRSPREVVPRGVREIDVRTLALQPALRRAGAKPVARRVTDPRQVARIVRWFDALNVVQPHTYVVGCVLVLSVPVRFVFRSEKGAELASAVVPSVPASSCEQIQFRLHGRPQTPLIDSTPEGGQSFIERVQRLLGVRFLPRSAGS